MDAEAATEHNFDVGETYSISMPNTGNQEFTLAGTVQFGSEGNSQLGAVLMFFTNEASQEHFGEPGMYDTIEIAVEDSASVEDVKKTLEGSLADDLEVLTAEELANDIAGEFNSLIAVFSGALLGLSLIHI